VTQLAFEGLSENEIGRARISMMARSDLLHARAGYRSARPVAATLKIQLATHGRSIQLGHSLQKRDVRARSALPLTATEERTSRFGSFVPNWEVTGKHKPNVLVVDIPALAGTAFERASPGRSSRKRRCLDHRHCVQGARRKPPQCRASARTSTRTTRSRHSGFATSSQKAFQHE
jgi:hypothetical protein